MGKVRGRFTVGVSKTSRTIVALALAWVLLCQAALGDELRPLAAGEQDRTDAMHPNQLEEVLIDRLWASLNDPFNQAPAKEISNQFQRIFGRDIQRRGDFWEVCVGNYIDLGLFMQQKMKEYKSHFEHEAYLDSRAAIRHALDNLYEHGRYYGALILRLETLPSGNSIFKFILLDRSPGFVDDSNNHVPIHETVKRGVSFSKRALTRDKGFGLFYINHMGDSLAITAVDTASGNPKGYYWQKGWEVEVPLETIPAGIVSGVKIVFTKDVTLRVRRDAVLSPVPTALSAVKDLILSDYAQHYKQRPYIVAIGGPAGIGKSTHITPILKILIEQEKITVLVVNIDWFFLIPDERQSIGGERREWDVSYVRYGVMREFLRCLKRGDKTITILKYDREFYADNGTYKEEKVNLEGVDIVLFEGLYVISNEARLGNPLEFVDFPIYAEAEQADIEQWKYTQESKKPSPRTQEQFEKLLQDELRDTQENIAPSKKNASVILGIDADHSIVIKTAKMSSRVNIDQFRFLVLASYILRPQAAWERK